MCYSLLGWVEVFRSGLKKHSDLLALGDVDWQLNEGLRAQTKDKHPHSVFFISHYSCTAINFFYLAVFHLLSINPLKGSRRTNNHLTSLMWQTRRKKQLPSMTLWRLSLLAMKKICNSSICWQDQLRATHQDSSSGLYL